MTLVSEVVEGIQKGTTYFFRLVSTDVNNVTTTGDIDHFLGGKPMVKITSVSPEGCAGTYSGAGTGGHVTVSVKGEGKFSISSPLDPDGSWGVAFPATLATGDYGVTARLWKSVASDQSSLTVP